MHHSDSEAVGPEEILYRRVPAGPPWCERGHPPRIYFAAFRPVEADSDGLSVFRARFISAAALAAQGKSPKGYYIAELLAKDLFAAGINVVPAPVPDVPGHALIPSLNYSNRKSREGETLQEMLTMRMCRRVLGPFGAEQ